MIWRLRLMEMSAPLISRSSRLSPTMRPITTRSGCLGSGQSTKSRKVMANSVFGVVQGSGTTEADGAKLAWNRGDVIVVPSWREHVHRSDTGAVLFRVTDEPVMKKLGFLREGNGAQ